MSPDVASALSDTLGLVDQALETCRTLDAENTELRAKVAEHENVILEKVAAASAKPVFDRALLDHTLDQLTRQSFIDPSARTKIAAEIDADPNAALRLAQRLASCAVPAHEEGSAVSKSAGQPEKPPQERWY